MVRHKFAFIIVIALLILTSCISSADTSCSLSPNLNVDKEQLEKDINNIDSYLADSSIVAQIDETGLRYVITREGNGSNPTLCNTVIVTYQGRFISNNEVFDTSNNPVALPLGNIITGWQIGLPKIKPGGYITLYIPSVYAYGSEGRDGIPPNSSLIFEINYLR